MGAGAAGGQHGPGDGRGAEVMCEPEKVIIGNAELWWGDYREVLPSITGIDAVVTDPPYGINANQQTLGAGKKEFARGKAWDAGLIDLAPMLAVGKYHCFWGGNYYTSTLPPVNSWLIWHKLNDGRSFSECEMAWTDFAKQTRHLSHHWGGEDKQHPTQKPYKVMNWTLSQLPPDALTICDPCMGSGTTGAVATAEGKRFVGIELERTYFDIACERIERAQQQGKLF